MIMAEQKVQETKQNHKLSSKTSDITRTLPLLFFSIGQITHTAKHDFNESGRYIPFAEGYHK